MAITIDDLRKNSKRQIEEYDWMIDLLEREKRAGIQNDGLGKPHRAWMGLLNGWRDETQAAPC